MNTILQSNIIRHEPNSDPGRCGELVEPSPGDQSINTSHIGPVGANNCSPSHGNQANDSIVHFLESLQADHISDNTIRSYSADIHRFTEFLKQRTTGNLDAVSSEDIEIFLRQMSFDHCSSSAIRRAKASLKKYFRFLVETGAISINPFEGASLEETFPDRLTLSTILGICAYCRRRMVPDECSESLRYRRDELIILLMIIYGIRQYHIGLLKLSKTTREGTTITIAVSETFSLKLEGPVLRRLLSYLVLRNSKSDVIFIESSGKPITPRAMHSLMIELSYAVRVQITPRTLYHSYLHLHRTPSDAAALLTELSHLDEGVRE